MDRYTRCTTTATNRDTRGTTMAKKPQHMKTTNHNNDHVILTAPMYPLCLCTTPIDGGIESRPLSIFVRGRCESIAHGRRREGIAHGGRREGIAHGCRAGRLAK
jgi:hypothetical protein